jgi:signal peptidase I
VQLRKNFMKQIILNTILITIILVAGFLFFTAKDNPLHLRTFTVMSGSMEPAIKTGSLVITSPKPFYYSTGSIITFHFGSQIVTHRVNEIAFADDTALYKTKGDANNTTDLQLTSQTDVIGAVSAIFPYAGYALTFAKTPPGFALLVIIPALAVIILEAITIAKEVKKTRTKKPDLLNSANHLLTPIMLFIISILINSLVVGKTTAYFSSLSTFNGNTISTGTWSSETTPTDTPTPTPTPISDHLVINEVYYDPDSSHSVGGSAESRWEWVELYNPTNSDIDVTGWSIGDSSNSDSFPGSLNIPAKKFVIVSPSSESELKTATPNGGNWSIPAGTLFIDLLDAAIGGGLNNDNDLVILKNNSGQEVDKMSCGSVKTGFNPPCSSKCPVVVTGHSLERNPAGKDTENANDFIDQNSPTPGS